MIVTSIMKDLTVDVNGKEDGMPHKLFVFNWKELVLRDAKCKEQMIFYKKLFEITNFNDEDAHYAETILLEDEVGDIEIDWM